MIVPIHANEFQRIKTYFRREFPEAICIFSLGKPRGYSNALEIFFQIKGAIKFNTINPIFRNGKQPLGMDTSPPDIRIATEKPVGKPWKITNETDIDVLIADLETVLRTVLSNLEEQTSLTAFVK